jgi:hypothetical protein
MAKKIKLELTEAQFIALTNLVDCMSSMGIDEQSVKDVRLIDKMLKNNGYKRAFE